jgi:signal transduction histidine kinase
VRIGLTIIAAAALLLLLTWVALRGMNAETGVWKDALQALDKIESSESALNRDVLSARSGMLRNYDSLVWETNAMRDAVARLHGVAAGDRELSAAVGELARAVDRAEQLTDQFKSRNALLQNSLAYFVVLGERLGGEEKSRDLVGQVSSLASAMLRLTLDTSPSATSGVDTRLRDISLDDLTPEDSAARPLLDHARLLRDLLPATDNIVKALFSSSAGQHRETARNFILARAAASEDAAGFFQYILYAISVLMVCLLVFLGAQLQSRARALRFRANLEHVIAGMSTRFINARPDELAGHVARALQEFAACIDADRAYFVAGEPPLVYQWCREGAEFPTGWPVRARSLASLFKCGETGTIHIPKVGRSSDGNSGNMSELTGAGLRGWLCIPGSGGKCGGGILGFDALQPGTLAQWHEHGLFRMAFDAIASAVDREYFAQEKERLETGLQQARRMETVGALASGIAHNFNNIVGAILGYAEMARERVEPESRMAGILGEIGRAGERARDLVDQILTFGRRGDIRRERVCVKALAAEAVSMLSASLPPDVEVRIQETPWETSVLGEPARLQQVLLNLCTNAAQAMDGAGVVELDIGVSVPGSALRHGQDELGPGRYTTITVTDNGCGMDEATRERVFEPFFTTRRGGNGLGLATSREIVREHGGAVTVRSAPGNGTRFEIWLPCAPPVHGQTESAPVQRVVDSSGRGNGETVLILDGDRERLLRNEEILAALGYEPVGFTLTAEAAEVCRPSPTQFDAALVCHPQNPALDIAAALHQAAPDLPIILATASADNIDAPALAAAGITELVHCPLISAELARALTRCLENQATSV